MRTDPENESVERGIPVDEQQLEELERAFELRSQHPKNLFAIAPSGDSISAARLFEMIDVLKSSVIGDGGQGGERSDAPLQIKKLDTGAYGRLIETRLDTGDGIGRGAGQEFRIERLGKETGFGRFEILKTLGQGGHGMVFLARDPQLDRLIALKVPRPEYFLTSELKQRFEREARAAAALSHPNIVPVYEAGTVGAASYIACQYVDGETLAEWMAKQKTPGDPIQAAQLVATLADAVQHAHQRGVLHRDLTPGNVLLRTSDSGIHPAITDFGLAALTDQATDITQTGAVVGTPSYMSPEQARGDKSQIGPATDVYGLGAILYELLTLRPPFRESSVFDTVTAVINRDPIPPMAINRNAPKDLQAICLKCLEKLPARRYPTAFELHADLQRLLGGYPVRARQVTRLDRLLRWSNRNPLQASLAAALFLALSIGLIVTWTLWRTSEIHRRLAEANGSRLQARSAELESLVDQMFDQVSRMPELSLHGMEPVRERMLSAVNGYYASLLSDAPGNEALQQKRYRSLLRLAGLKMSLADHQGAIDSASQVKEELELTRHPSSKQLEIDALMLLAEGYWNLGRKQNQQECLDAALGLARDKCASLSNPSDGERIELAKTLSDAASITGLWGDRTLSNELATEAVAIWQSIDPQAILDAAILSCSRSYAIAAKSRIQSENAEAARVYAQPAIALIELTMDEATRSLPEAQFLLADAYHSMGVSYRTELPQALPYFDRGLEIAQALAALHPLVPKYQRQAAGIEMQRGLTYYVAYIIDAKAADAQSHLESSRQIYQDALDDLSAQIATFPDDASSIRPMLITCVTMIGLIHGERKEFDDQLAALQQALQWAEEIYDESGSPQSRLNLLGIRGNLGYLYLELGRYGESIEEYEFANTGLMEILQADPENGEAARFLSSNGEFAAKSYVALHRFDDALQVYRQSMQAYRQGPQEAMMGLEAVYLACAGDFSAAQQQFERFAAFQFGLLEPGVEWLPGQPASENQVLRALPKLLQHACRLISAIDTKTIAMDALAAALRDSAAETAVDALRKLDESPDLSSVTIEQLLGGDTLEPLWETGQFQDWLASRNQ